MKEPSTTSRKIPSLCIAGTHSGCGKTTVSLGIMAALVKRGLKVQAFKAGPDFIDPGHHRRITGRDSHNLDGWMLSRRYNQEIFARHSRDAEVAVLEGVMGLFDGFSGADESGSTAQMAKWLNLPVILVIDARSMARSAAAVALGYTRFDPELPLSGVIFNRVAGEFHAEILGNAMASLFELPVYGYLPRDEKLEIPSRHLGLVTDEDFGIDDDRQGRLAAWIENNLNLDELLGSMEEKETGNVSYSIHGEPDIRIGVARDEAFCFYYPENLRLLREAGAELIPFSPIRSRNLPRGIKGLYFGGGYPELHCKALSENHGLLDAIRDFGLGGGPIYGECGGFMYLMREISDLEGQTYPMVGLFPMGAQMENRLKALGYREIITRKRSVLGQAGTTVRGHEFHYSQIREMGPAPETIYSMADRKAAGRNDEGFMINNVLGSYVHLHWGSNPETAGEFVDFCRKYG